MTIVVKINIRGSITPFWETLTGSWRERFNSKTLKRDLWSNKLKVRTLKHVPWHWPLDQYCFIIKKGDNSQPLFCSLHGLQFLNVFYKNLRICKLRIRSQGPSLTVNLLVNCQSSIIYGHFAENYVEFSLWNRPQTLDLNLGHLML